MSHMIDINKPVANPALIAAIEALKQEGSPDNLNRVVNEVVHANFLSPVTISPMPEFNSGEEATLKEGATVSFHLIENSSEGSYFPAFTDWEELRKWNAADDMQTLISTFDDYAFMVLGEDSDSAGFVINPFGANLPFTREMINSIKNQKDKMEQKGIGEYTVEKDTKVLLGQPREYPDAMLDAVCDYFKTQRDVEKAYFLMMVKEETEESSYLLVIDYKGDPEEILGGIADAAAPYLNGMYLDMVPYDSEFGQNAADKTEPFYKRKRFGLF